MVLECAEKRTKIKVADLADYVDTMTQTDGFSQEFKVSIFYIFIY